jgi:hypothetical protein
VLDRIRRELMDDQERVTPPLLVKVMFGQKRRQQPADPRKRRRPRREAELEPATNVAATHLTNL